MNIHITAYLFQSFEDHKPILGTFANRADPVHIPQNAASNQGLHSLLTGTYSQTSMARTPLGL